MESVETKALYNYTEGLRSNLSLVMFVEVVFLIDFLVSFK